MKGMRIRDLVLIETRSWTRKSEPGDRVRIITMILGVLLLLATGLCGCANLSAVKDYATISQQASQQFPVVAPIPYQSCVAMQQYVQLKNVTVFATNFTFDQTVIDNNCNKYKERQADLEKVNKVLVNYLATLAKLATDETTAFDSSVSGLAKNATSLTTLTTTQQTAVQGLAGVFMKAAEGLWRQHEVKQAIVAANDHMHAVCQVMESLGADYDLFAGTQRQGLNALYDKMAEWTMPVNSMADTTKAEETIIAAMNERSQAWAVLLTKNFVNDVSSINGEVDAVKALTEMYQKIDEGHAELYKNLNDLTKNQTMLQLFQVSAQIADKAVQVKKALK